MNIDYIHEPTDLQCGQAVLAMLLGTTAEYICEYLGNSRETDLREMKRVLTDHGINFSPERKQAQTVFDLPRCALLSLETPRCWHWSLYADGVFSAVCSQVLLGDISRNIKNTEIKSYIKLK